jgi:hypothetical protein
LRIPKIPLPYSMAEVLNDLSKKNLLDYLAMDIKHNFDVYPERTNIIVDIESVKDQ